MCLLGWIPVSTGAEAQTKSSCVLNYRLIANKVIACVRSESRIPSANILQNLSVRIPDTGGNGRWLSGKVPLYHQYSERNSAHVYEVCVASQLWIFTDIPLLPVEIRARITSAVTWSVLNYRSIVKNLIHYEGRNSPKKNTHSSLPTLAASSVVMCRQLRALHKKTELFFVPSLGSNLKGLFSK